MADIGDLSDEDVNLYGPLFVCLADKANLAEEIRIRTNIFDGIPVSRKEINSYLPWDRLDDEGNEQPRYDVVDVGTNGEKLRCIYDTWTLVDGLRNGGGFLRSPTATFSRSIMKLHKSTTIDSRLNEVFVGLVTVIESILNPDSQSELTYKTALRGAALLTSSPEERLLAFKIINGFYSTRSEIVHEGQSDGSSDEEIELGLVEIST